MPRFINLSDESILPGEEIPEDDIETTMRVLRSLRSLALSHTDHPSDIILGRCDQLIRSYSVRYNQVLANANASTNQTSTETESQRSEVSFTYDGGPESTCGGPTDDRDTGGGPD